MAVVDNAGADLGATVGSSIRNFEPAMPDSNGSSDADHHPNNLSCRMADPNMQQNAILRSPSSHDQSFQMKVQQQQQRTAPPADHVSNHHPPHPHGVDQGPKGGATAKPGMGPRNGEGFQRDMRDLEELLSKLNPMAEEFIPPSLAGHGSAPGFYSNNFWNSNGGGNGNNRRVLEESLFPFQFFFIFFEMVFTLFVFYIYIYYLLSILMWCFVQKKNYYSQGKRRMNSRTSMAQREEVIRRTVYVSDIDQQVICLTIL